MGGVVDCWIDPSGTSDAVRFQLPAVLKVTLMDCVPLTSAALTGAVALGSVKVITVVSLVPTTFQKASTALTVRLNAVPAACVEGVPVFPVNVPGAALSPGASTCNWIKAAGLTTTLLDVVPVSPVALKAMLIVLATL